MRFFATLIAVIIAIQVCIPCSDRDECQDTTQKDTGMHLLSFDEHSSQETDLCSPFCICACCSVKMSQPALFELILFPPDYAIDNFPFVQGANPSVVVPIWQPPKV